MEEQLSQQFDCIKFIESHLQGTQDIDMQLTDLSFQLQLLKSDSEEQIIQETKSIYQNQDQIIQDTQQLFKELIDYKELQDLYISQTLPFLSQDNKLYQKMDECLRYKKNIRDSLDMFEIVMQLDQIYEQYQKIIEDNDIQQLLENIKNNIRIFKILLQLPKMSPRYGQIEKIVNLIEQYCHQELFTSKQSQQKLEILDLLDISSRASSIYLQQRLKVIDLSQLTLNDLLNTQDAQELVHLMISITDNELQYLRNMNNFQSFFFEFLKYLISYFNKNLFKQYFNFENQYNRNLEFLYGYLTYYNILQSYSDKGYLQPKHFDQILKLAFEPYSTIIKIIVKNECQFLQGNINFQIDSTKSINEKLASFDFNKQDILEQSFKRCYDLSFQIAFEDWVFECIKILDNLLIILNQIIDEIPLDQFGQYIQSIINQSENQQFIKGTNSKFQMKLNISLFELLITKHYELHNFRMNQLVELDTFIRKTIEKNMEEELLRQISQIIREKLQMNRNKAILNQYMETLSLTSALRQLIEECENKLSIHILRLLLQDSLNQDQDYIHSFTTNLELIENIFKSIKANKINFKACVNLNQNVSYEELEEKSKNNYFSQPTCFWATMHILVETNSKEGFDSSSDDEYLDQFKTKCRTLDYYEGRNKEEEKKQYNSQTVQQYRNLTLNVSELTFNNSTIFLGQPFYNTQQIHNLIENKENSNDFEFQPQILRPFLGMLKQGIQFSSTFESGNLDRVDYISNEEYNLFMRIDTNSIGHSNWFYFKTTNNQLNKIKFNICNFTKPQSLYTKGMKPYILSKKGSQKYFTQQGEFIKYYQVGELYVLSFIYQYEYVDDEVEFATLPPYKYTELRRKIKKWHKKYKQYLTKLKLTTTLSGLVLPLLVITDKNINKNKKIIIVTARIHPSETCSSFMIESFMASYLKKNIIFKIIPMLNPDGVIVGNFRNGLSGVDLNRQFLETDLTLLPEVKALKSLIEDNSTQLIGYLDFHGHQVRKNIFLYGPQSNNANLYSKIFPLILQQRLESFRYKSCEFGIPKFKMGTARAFANCFIDALCYTIEASFCGYQKGKSFKFISKDWIQAGQCIGETLFLYFNFKQVNSKQLKQNQLMKIINEMSSKVEQTEAKHESDDQNDSQSDAEIFEDYDKDKLANLQSQMKAELSQQNLVVINNGDSQRKRMKAQTVSRKIKIQPIIMMNKNQRKPIVYPELNIQNWEFSNKTNQSIDTKTSFQQKGIKNKISSSFRFVSSKRANSLHGTSPINQITHEINTTQQIQPTLPIQIPSKLNSNNFPILENNSQISTPQYLPFITKLLKSKRIVTQS
ncbi:unnamed protein product [Paramecium primaurelia]|uniref:Peptidase M14 domain-containing protein n=1 Tax=Paramecium primaurelia TaxID=5886 RepID=A0A8S1JTA9_PARPR|nr:unnamed protein product [Paramecium primaurelia]